MLFLQLYAPTTLAPARDFWLLRYTSVMEDGSLVVCLYNISCSREDRTLLVIFIVKLPMHLIYTIVYIVNLSLGL